MRRFTLTVLGAVLLFALAGCSPGNKGIGSTRSIIQQRAIETARNARATFAIAGLGRRAKTRAPRQRVSVRIAAVLSALRRTREIVIGYDEEMQLHYAVTTQPDGAGRIDLFTDSKRTERAGDFVWDAPRSLGATPGEYPLFCKQTYRIAKGEFAGNRGTLELTLYDAEAVRAVAHIVNENEQGEKIDTLITFENQIPSAEGTIYTPQGDWWREYDYIRDDGVMICRFTFPDGAWGEMTMEGEGSGDIVYYGDDNTPDAWGSYNEDGDFNANYNDGTSETVDIDTWDDGYYDDADYWEDEVWDDFEFDDDDRKARSKTPRQRAARPITSPR